MPKKPSQSAKKSGAPSRRKLPGKTGPPKKAPSRMGISPQRRRAANRRTNR